jgi:LPXTG-motif cell wall-anchored protein
VADGPTKPADWSTVADAKTFSSDATNREAVVSDLAAGDYTITESEVSGMTTTVSGGKENKNNEEARSITVTVTAGENVDATAKATFNNNTTPMTSFNFNKIWLGPTGNVATPTSYQDWQEDITVTIKRKAGANGAEDDNFALKYTISKSEDTFIATMDTSASKLPTVEGELNALTLTGSSTSNVFNFTLPVESLRKYNDDGTEWVYYVVEDEVPLYVTSYGAATTGDSGTSYSATPGASDAKNGGVIVNQTFGGYELPHTGGVGTAMFTTVGSMLLLGAALALHLLQRRRRKEGESPV